jgi:glutamine amidotransferase
MIGIIDYGVGNIASVANAFEHLGYETRRCISPNEAESCERLILPGVGSFRSAMEALNSGGWVGAIKSAVDSGRPLLGICLGMQLLFECSEEHGHTQGLGLIPGDVILLRPPPPLKVPHVGWNSLIKVTEHPVFNGVRSNVDVYFVHSYHCVPKNKTNVVAHCILGDQFVAAVAHQNIFGVQFHPEKSQPSGLIILNNFAKWNAEC